jgi:hypothetical protein
MNTITKTPIEKFPIRFNFSVDLGSTETVVSIALTCINSATGAGSYSEIVDSSLIVSPEVTIVVKAGVEGDEHSIQCVVTTSLGNTFQRDLLLMVQTVVDDSFSKQPGDAFLFDVDFTRRLETSDTVASGAVLATKESDGTDASLGAPAENVVSSVAVVTPKVGVHVAAGADGETYLLGVRATTVVGYTYEKNIRMSVQEL